MSQQPIILILKQYGNSTPILEIPNYQGYIPHPGDFINFPTAIGRSSIKIQGRDFEFKDNVLISVTLWV